MQLLVGIPAASSKMDQGFDVRGKALPSRQMCLTDHNTPLPDQHDGRLIEPLRQYRRNGDAEPQHQGQMDENRPHIGDDRLLAGRRLTEDHGLKIAKQAGKGDRQAENQGRHQPRDSS